MFLGWWQPRFNIDWNTWIVRAQLQLGSCASIQSPSRLCLIVRVGILLLWGKKANLLHLRNVPKIVISGFGLAVLLILDSGEAAYLTTPKHLQPTNNLPLSLQEVSHQNMWNTQLPTQGQ